MISGLKPDPSVAQMKWFAANAARTFESFVKGLEHFGREPGESWHADADQMTQSYAELKKVSTELAGSSSLRTVERRSYAAQLNSLAATLSGLRSRLIGEIINACPPLEPVRVPDRTAAATWALYDELIGKLDVHNFNRQNIQRLLQRAHQPMAAALLVMGAEVPHGKMIDFLSLYSLLGRLVESTPLPSREGKTLKELDRERLRATIAEERDPSKGVQWLTDFVAGVNAKDPASRKAARKDLKNLWKVSLEEEHGRSPESQWKNCRLLLAVWDAVQSSLDHPDARYRRGALCALPTFQFSIVVDQFAEECEPFILKGLRDPDGMVRYKVVRFAADFYDLVRLDRPGLATSLEGAVQALLERTRRKEADIAASIRKLQGRFEWTRGYDRQLAFSRAGGTKHQPGLILGGAKQPLELI